MDSIKYNVIDILLEVKEARVTLLTLVYRLHVLTYNPIGLHGAEYAIVRHISTAGLRCPLYITLFLFHFASGVINIMNKIK